MPLHDDILRKEALLKQKLNLNSFKNQVEDEEDDFEEEDDVEDFEEDEEADVIEEETEEVEEDKTIVTADTQEKRELTDREKFDEASKESIEDDEGEEDDFEEEEESEGSDEDDFEAEIADEDIFQPNLQVTSTNEEILANLKRAFTLESQRGLGKKAAGVLKWKLINKYLPQALKVAKKIEVIGGGAKIVIKLGNDFLELPVTITKKVFAGLKSRAKEELTEALKKFGAKSAEAKRLQKWISLIDNKKIKQAGKVMKGLFEIIKLGGAIAAGPEFAAAYIAGKIGAEAATKEVVGKYSSKVLRKALPLISKTLVPIVGAGVGAWDVYNRNIDKGDNEVQAVLKAFGAGIGFLASDAASTGVGFLTTAVTGLPPAGMVAAIITNIAGDLANAELWTGDKHLTLLPEMLADYEKNPKQWEDAIVAEFKKFWNKTRDFINSKAHVNLPNWDELPKINLDVLYNTGKWADGTPIPNVDPADTNPAPHSTPPGTGPFGPSINPTPHIPGLGRMSAIEAPLDFNSGTDIANRQTQSVVDRRSSLLDELDGVKKKKVSEQQKAADAYIAAQRGTGKSRY